MYQVIYYETADGEKPVKEFVNSLDPVTKAAFFHYAQMLADQGPNLPRPYADIVDGKIREIRPRQARVLYFFHHRTNIILVHGFLKKSQKVKQADIETANKRMKDWIERNGS